MFNIWWLPGKWMEMVYVSKKKKKRKRKEQENEREKLMVQIVGIEWERDEGTIWFLKNHHSSLTQFLSFIILSLITYNWKNHNFLRWHVGHLFLILIIQKILLFVRPTNWLGAAFTSYFFFSFLFSFIPQHPNSPKSVKRN